MTQPQIFWRDARMPYVEVRRVEDGRKVHYAPHSHTQWSMGAITSGFSTFQYREDFYKISEGDLVFMNPHWVHACNPINNQPWSYYMMYVDAQWLTQLRIEQGLLDSPVWNDIATATLTEEHWFNGYVGLVKCLMNSKQSLLQKQSTLVEFLADLFLDLDDVSEAQVQTTPDVLHLVANTIREKAAEEISLEDLCVLSGYSQGYLIRSFKQYFGLTPHAYQVNARIQLGQQGLKQGKSISEAALDAGFSDQPHFQRTFKKLVAATPSQYRK